MSLEVYRDPSDRDLKDPRLLRLRRYWLGLRDDGRLPSRDDVDPADLVPVLPLMFLIDVLAPGGYRYRLVGTEVVAGMGYDMTGQLVSRAYAGPDWNEVRKDYEFVIEDRRPCLTVNDVVLKPARLRKVYRRLLLPLASDGRNVDVLMGAVVFVL